MTFKANPWTRATSGARWTRPDCAYEVCLNDTGRSFRVMYRDPLDGYLWGVKTYRRVRTLAVAQSICEALATQKEATH